MPLTPPTPKCKPGKALAAKERRRLGARPLFPCPLFPEAAVQPKGETDMTVPLSVPLWNYQGNGEQIVKKRYGGRQ